LNLKSHNLKKDEIEWIHNGWREQNPVRSGDTRTIKINANEIAPRYTQKDYQLKVIINLDVNIVKN
jgi:hypothetical protein